MECEIGDTFKVPEAFGENIKVLSKRIEAARSAMQAHAEDYDSAQRSMWNTLREIIPELDVSKFSYGFDAEMQVVKCNGLI